MRAPGDILLVACYELGHQPLAVAWPAAMLEKLGYRPAMMDVSVEPFDGERVRRAKTVSRGSLGFWGGFAVASKTQRRRPPRTRLDGKGLIAIRLAFAHKFGRLPEGGDPVFFDPHADRPSPLPSGERHRALVEAMLEYGTAPEIVYAFCRTGVAVYEKTRQVLPPEQVSRWDTAIKEYFAFGEKTKNIQH